jgi:hypothetical protein
MTRNRLFRGMSVSVCGLLCLATMGAARAPTWKTIKPEVGGFSFQMPTAPKPLARASGKDAGPLDAVSYGMEVPGGAIFVMSQPVRPKGAGATLVQQLDAIRDEIVSKAQRKLVDEKEIALDGHTGRQLNIEQPQGFNNQVRIFILEDREVQMSALWKGTEMPADMGRFLKSLKLPKKKSG